MIDADCRDCDFSIRDVFHMATPDRVYHVGRDGRVHEMEQVLLPRQRKRTQWDERDAVVVFRKPDGTYSYPAVNNKPTPQGCERIVMRSLREVEAFEKRANVRSEIAWYDRGSGRGHDDDFRGSRYD